MRYRLSLTLAMTIAAIFAATTPILAATATLTAPATADVGETVTASVTLSDVDILAIAYLNWGDGNENAIIGIAGTYEETHVYEASGMYAITVTVDGTPVTSMITIETYDGSFADDDGHLFVADIEWLSAAGITRGCNPPTNTLFCPDQVVTRGQMAAFLTRALSYTDTGTASFSDTVGHTFETDINRLAAAGVTRGCNPPDNDQFCPDSPVTRGQMAAFLTRAFDYNDAGTADFVDTVGNTFESDIAKLATAGVTRGCNPPDNDRYCPDSSVTRGQMAAFLHRAMGG